MRMWRLIVLCIVVIPLVGLSAYFWTSSDVRTTELEADPEVLANQGKYLRRAKSGDTRAGYDLALAYLLTDPTDDRVVSVLRLVARRGDSLVDELLGQTLLKRQLKRQQLGNPVDEDEEREAIALLKSASETGRPYAKYRIDTYLKRKADYLADK